MSALNKNEKTMKPSEIIVKDAERNGIDGQQLLQGIAYNIKKGNTKIMQSGNSVLTMQRMSEIGRAHV